MTIDLHPPFADRQSRLGTETAFEVLARAKQLEREGKHIVHLEIGEPDFDTPDNIREAAKRYLDEGYTHYGPSAGLHDVLEVIATHDSARRPGTAFTPANIVITPGAKPILFYGLFATVNAGDEVIYPNPGFPIYESVIRYLDAVPVPLPLQESKGFAFDMQDLVDRITPRTRMVIVNTPSNPTGGIVEEADLRQLAELAQKHNFWVLSDEIYDRILYGGANHFSITQVPGMADRTIIVNGSSKTYAMTGWRIGYGIMPADLATQVARLATNCNSCTASFIQKAYADALTGPQDSVATMLAEFDTRRQLIVAGLNDIPGITCTMPKGAFYAFPNISALGKKSKWFENYLLNEHGVAALTGTSFGTFGEGYLRLSYANSRENISEALRRIRTAVEQLPA
ncbi:MAG: Aspartate aminotransferase [bacterium]|nr:Aspartate aminotransferase [bacterium]